MAKVTPVSLDDPGNPIRCEFSLIDPEAPGKWHILLARFVGTYRIGCKGNPDAMFIASMHCSLLCRAWENSEAAEIAWSYSFIEAYIFINWSRVMELAGEARRLL